MLGTKRYLDELPISTLSSRGGLQKADAQTSEGRQPSRLSARQYRPRLV